MKINIMYIITSVSGGGAELVVYYLCKYLNREKFNVSVCCLDELGGRGEILKKQGYDIFSLKRSPNKFDKYLVLYRVFRVIQKYNIKILHSHDRASLFVCSLCNLANKYTRHLHTFHYGNYKNLTGKNKFLEKIHLKFVNQLIAVGDNQTDDISNCFNIDKNIIRTIYNGIDTLDQPTKHSKQSDTRIIIGTICIFTKQKGLEDLLMVAKRITNKHKNVFFKIVGDGPERENIITLKNDLGLNDEVEFMGWIPNASNTILHSFDIFIQTSHWEAMSIAILEAMFAALPIVATNVGDNKEIIAKAACGYVLEPGDVEGLTSKLQLFITNESPRTLFGKRGHNLVINNYTVDHMLNNYENLYSSSV